MAEESFDTDQVLTSKFYMLRCVIAMAHADGKVDDAEREHFDRYIKNLPFSADQLSTIHSDLETQQDVADLLKYINDPRYLSQVTYFARLMAYADGVLHPNEEKLLEYFHLKSTEHLDMDAINEQVQIAVEKEMAEYDAELQKIRPELDPNPLKGRFLFWMLDRFCLMLGIDLMAE